MVMKSKKLRIVFVGLLIFGILSAYYFYWVHIKYRFLTVRENQVYQSAQMPLEELESKIHRYGIRAVINLDDDMEKAEAEQTLLKKLGVFYFHLPSGQIPEDKTIDMFLKLMKHKEHRPVLIHCEHGIGRANLFTALYRIEFEDWSNERARLAAFWQSGCGSEFRPSKRKGKFIRNYTFRLQQENLSK